MQRIIHGRAGIQQAYLTGRGSVLMRARTEVEKVQGTEREQIVVTEIPYQVNKARLAAKIGELIRDKRIEGIREVRDESDRDGMRLVIELKKDVFPQVVQNHLFRLTDLQSSFGINLIFTWQGAVIAATVVAFPLVFKAARAAFESVEPQYEQAARVLGHGEWAVFFRVTLPLAWRGILAGVLLSFARATGEFGATLMVAGSIPGKTQTLSVAVYEAVQAGQDDVANFLVLVTSVTCLAVLLAAGKLAPGRVAGRVAGQP